jgi:hypothetical protein
MFKSLSKLVDKFSEFLAPRKGLLPFIGIVLICLNYIFQFLPLGWVRETDLFLHLGLVVAIFGLMLARVL